MNKQYDVGIGMFNICITYFQMDDYSFQLNVIS